MVSPIIEEQRSGVTEAIKAAPYLTSFPGSIDHTAWEHTRRFRQPVLATDALPNWWPHDERPLLYATFGTVLGHLLEGPLVYRSVLDAVSELEARVLLTVGRATDVAQHMGLLPRDRPPSWAVGSDPR